MSDFSQRVPLRGGAVTTPEGPTPTAEKKPNGQYEDYWVLSDEERAKGFVRPVRRTYVHKGLAGPQHPLRDLTDKEQERHADCDYVKYEPYPKGSAALGRYWTQEQLDKIDGGCGSATTMSQEIAETYARNPRFYGSTFCVSCGKHLPVAEFVWDDGERVGS